jgi:hypothetical protein
MSKRDLELTRRKVLASLAGLAGTRLVGCVGTNAGSDGGGSGASDAGGSDSRGLDGARLDGAGESGREAGLPLKDSQAGDVSDTAPEAIPFDYFIAPHGDDNNPGTLASPWSITAFNSKMSTYSGKRVGIVGDVAGVQTPIQYGTVGGVQTTLYSIVNTQANIPAIKTNGGTSAASTYIASCNSSGVYTRGWAIVDPSNPAGGAPPTKDECILMGQNTNSVPMTEWVSNPDYITFDGLTIRNFSYCAISLENPGSFRTEHTIVQNCEFYSGGGIPSANNPGAIRYDNTNNAQVINCKFHDMTTSSSGSFYPYAYPGIMSYDSTALTVTNCTFYKCVSIEQKDATQDAVISYCYLDAGDFGQYTGDSYGAVYYLGVNAVGRTTTMHHNIVLGMIWNQGASGQSYAGNWKFYNNTCYVGNGTSPIFYLNPGAGSTFDAYNNVLCPQPSVGWGTEYGSTKFIGANSTLAPQWDYNYYLTEPTFYTGSSISYTAWQALGFDAHSHIGGSPFSGTPVAHVPSSFALNPSSAAYTGGVGGKSCGALDGSGSVGCNF